MAVPKFHIFMKPLLELLNDGKEHKIQTIYSDLADYFQLSDIDKSEMLPSGRQLLYRNRIGWAKTFLKKAGLIDSLSRATFSINDLGRSVIAENPTVIDPQYLMKFPSFREFMNSQAESSNAEDEKTQRQQIVISDLKDNTPQDELDSAYKKIVKSLQDDLLLEIMQLNPDFFEKLVVDLVVAMGYGGTAEDAARVVGKSGDEGIDGVIKSDRLGFDRIYIQAKKWDPSRTVGRPEIQRFVGALVGQGASKGLFITTCSFTKEAIEFVEKTISQRIVLIDGKQLASLMIEHNIGVSTQFVLALKSIDRDYFENGN